MNKQIDYLKSLSTQNDEFQRKLNIVCGTSIAPLSRVKIANHVDDVLDLLRTFPDCAGYSANRREKRILSLDGESGVQDLIYFMLKPAITDLVPETPVAGFTRQYTIQDFRSVSLRLVIEAKRIRNKTHGRAIKTELHDDIGNYKNDPYCDDLIFFIYDPEIYIESITGLRDAIEGEHSRNKRSLRVHCIVQR
jgi:hypothetical protein